MHTEATLERLRTWYRTLDTGTSEAEDAVDTWNEIEQMARRTPAWIEPSRTICDRLGLVRSPEPSCPQLVDVDFPTMGFARAEWVDGNLCLRLAPERENPSVFTSFRVVGAEPRNWDVHGIDGVSLDLTSSALHVRVPLIAGDVELIRSSY